MAIPSFFKQNKPRGFNYVPRYYDPVKEERELRRMALREQMGSNPATGDDGPDGAAEKRVEPGSSDDRPYRSRITRGSMRNYFPRNREKVQRHNMIRLVVIILILFLITFFYLRF